MTGGEIETVGVWFSRQKVDTNTKLINQKKGFLRKQIDIRNP